MSEEGCWGLQGEWDSEAGPPVLGRPRTGFSCSSRGDRTPTGGTAPSPPSPCWYLCHPLLVSLPGHRWQSQVQSAVCSAGPNAAGQSTDRLGAETVTNPTLRFLKNECPSRPQREGIDFTSRKIPGMGKADSSSFHRLTKMSPENT